MDVPQVREGGFDPSSLEKGLRSERALTCALAEMYVLGVATRSVAQITEQFCGVSVSASQVNKAAAEVDSVLSSWRDRPLSECRYLSLDARYKVERIWGSARKSTKGRRNFLDMKSRRVRILIPMFLLLLIGGATILNLFRFREVALMEKAIRVADTRRWDLELPDTTGSTITRH